MIPNKTEEQILYQFFKYYDMDGSHTCNLQNFIKTNERIGVSLSKLTDLEKIFNYFDKEKRGVINYKQFSHDIFNLKNKEQNPNDYDFSSNDFPTILSNHLIHKGGNLSLINLIKNLKIIDYNNSNRMTIDDFLKVLNESYLGLDPNEFQTIFQDYELFANGTVYYNRILEILFDKFFTKSREIFAENLYYNLTNNGQNKISLKDMKNSYLQTSNNDPRKDLFIKFIDKYKYITNSSIDKPISLNEMKQFIKYIGYGIESDEELRELLYELENYNNLNSHKLKSSHKPNQLYSNDKNMNENSSEDILLKLRRKLIQYNRKTLFNFIKQFKHYDHNTRTISKYDFMKVLQDFNIIIPDSDIDQLFNEYGSNQRRTIIYYLDFLNKLSHLTINQNRENAIKNASNFIYNKSNELRKPINLDLLKELYSPENNYFIADENENRIDFIDCLELYHYAYKGFLNDNFYREEFFEFYHFISFLIENDNNFITLLKNEWKEKNINNNNNFNFTFGRPTNQEYLNNNNNKNINNLKNKNRQFNQNNNNYNEENYNPINNQKRPENISGNNYNVENKNNLNPLEKLKKNLKGRGLRGLLYLHRQFLFSCSNTNNITLNEFKKILQGQHFPLNDSEYKYLFNTFSKDGLYLDFPSFIREFKKELNNNKLNYVEDAYLLLDKNQNEKVPIEYIKKEYDAKNHPDVISGKKSEEENLLEFIDCFEINFDLLNPDKNINFVDFEVFANFYEYVAFIYDNDKEFGKVILSTFH